MDSDYNHVMAVAELAHEFNVTQQTMNNWTLRWRPRNFPDPIRVLSCGALYDIRQIIHWAATHEPRLLTPELLNRWGQLVPHTTDTTKDTP